MRRGRVGVLMVGAGLALGGCGHSSATPATPATTGSGAGSGLTSAATPGSAAGGATDGPTLTGTPVSSATSAPTPLSQTTTTAQPTESSAPVGGAPCTAAQLDVSLGSRAVSGSRTSVAVLFRNASATSCTVAGWPGVDLVDEGGMQVGPAAAQLPGDFPTRATTTVTVRPGASAGSTLSYAAATTAPGCDGAVATGLLVFVPGRTTSTRVSFNAAVCTATADRPSVTPVVEAD